MIDNHMYLVYVTRIREAQKQAAQHAEDALRATKTAAYYKSLLEGLIHPKGIPSYRNQETR